MTGSHSEIIILIDTSAFSDKEWKVDLIDHVKEAVSFQISRGAITNRKLIRLGLEPYLARVKWTYIFFDSTQTQQSFQQKTASILGQSMKTLTYECWDLFEEELNTQVKSRSPPLRDTNISVNSQIQNVIKMLQSLKFPCNWPYRTRSSNPDLPTSLSTSSQQSVEKFIIVFTTIPKVFSCLVHLATGITKCKYSMSVTANCSPADIQICFVDITFDSVSLQEQHGGLGKLPCFWDDVCSITHQQQCNKLPDRKLNLRVSCLKTIMMIHKLMEMRFPWMYDHSLPFGLGMGMKRLRQWEWRIPQELPELPQSTIRRGCLSLRKCCSEEMYCGHLI